MFDSAILQTIAHQPVMSMGFSRQEYSSGLSFPPPQDIPKSRVNPRLSCLLYWQTGSLPLVLPGQPIILHTYIHCISYTVYALHSKNGRELTVSEHELIARFRLKLKKVRKTIRPFSYDLNQIPCDYSVEVTNRFKGLDLIRVPKELWTKVHDIVKETVIKTVTQNKKCRKAKWLSEKALQIDEKREAKGKGEKERYTHLNAEFQRIARRYKKGFLSDQCKEIEENKRMGKTRDLFKKLET